MGLLKWILKKFTCNSSCTYNIENEIYDNNILGHTLNQYSLKLKDLKKIYRILNKREMIIGERLGTDYPIGSVII